MVWVKEPVQQSLKTMIRIRDVDPVDHSKHFAPPEEGVLYFERWFVDRKLCHLRSSIFLLFSRSGIRWSVRPITF